MALHRPRPIDRRTLLARSAAVAALAGSLRLQAFAGQASPSPEAGDAAIAALVAGNTAFAFDLYRVFRKEIDGNVIFSPYSISMALAMIHAGARGETAAQMEQVLAFSPSAAATGAAFASLTSDLLSRGNGDDDRGERELRIANALWGEESFPFSDAFVKELEVDYDAGVQVADFANDPEAAREAINAWVAERTNDRIEEIVPEDLIDEATRLVLANAIFFASNWRSAFEEADTGDDPFHLSDGTTVDVPFMTQTSNFPYREAERAQVVELPYVADGLAMTIILPEEGELDAVETRLDPDTLGGLVDGLGSERIELHLPKFEFDLGESLGTMLEALGMTDAFDPERADLTGMVEDAADRLVVSEVLHEAFISVDEAGTEAAAATVAGISVTSAPTQEEPIVVRVDRPFLFVIRDTETGTLLFLGRVMDPAGT